MIRKMNVIHTEPGILQGFTIRYIRIVFVLFKRLIRIKIPIRILSYNKAEAQAIRELVEKIQKNMDDV